METQSMYLQNESIDKFCAEFSLKENIDFDEILEMIIDSEEYFNFENPEYQSTLEIDEMILTIGAILIKKKPVNFDFKITEQYKKEVINYLEHVLENDHPINEIWEQEVTWFSFLQNIILELKGELDERQQD